MSRTLFAALCAALVVSCAHVALAEQAADCPDDTSKFARVDVTIESDRIKVEPFTQTIYLDEEPRRVCWVVNNLAERRTLHIEKKSSARSVFSGKTISSPSTFVSSGVPELDLEPGQSYTWSYNLKVTETGKTEALLFRDPEVIIEKKKGGGP